MINVCSDEHIAVGANRKTKKNAFELNWIELNSFDTLIIHFTDGYGIILNHIEIIVFNKRFCQSYLMYILMKVFMLNYEY